MRWRSVCDRLLQRFHPVAVPQLDQSCTHYRTKSQHKLKQQPLPHAHRRWTDPHPLPAPRLGLTQPQPQPHTDTHRHTHRYTQRHRQTDTHTHTDTHTQTHKQTDRQTDTHTEPHSHIHTHQLMGVRRGHRKVPVPAVDSKSRSCSRRCASPVALGERVDVGERGGDSGRETLGCSLAVLT